MNSATHWDNSLTRILQLINKLIAFIKFAITKKKCLQNSSCANPDEQVSGKTLTVGPKKERK